MRSKRYPRNVRNKGLHMVYRGRREDLLPLSRCQGAAGYEIADASHLYLSDAPEAAPARTSSAVSFGNRSLFRRSDTRNRGEFRSASLIDRRMRLTSPASSSKWAPVTLPGFQK